MKTSSTEIIALNTDNRSDDLKAGADTSDEELDKNYPMNFWSCHDCVLFNTKLSLIRKSLLRITSCVNNRKKFLLPSVNFP